MLSLLSFSGGLDSTTLLYKLREQGDSVHPIFFSYGSKHGQYEAQAAQRILENLGLRAEHVDLSGAGIFSRNASALLASSERSVPDTDYAEEGSLAATVVPGRNMIMAAILASKAEQIALEHCKKVKIALAVHAGDHALYPDCRPKFVDSLYKAIFAQSEARVQLVTPFLHKTKAEIVAEGHKLGVPFALTRSCYKDQELACGTCGTCRERLAAFAANGIVDPLPYSFQG